jgi:hypothetical protein
MLKNELVPVAIELSKQNVYEYIVVAIGGAVLSLLMMGRINKKETIEAEILELELKIKRLEYDRKLKEQNAPRKYIRVK